MVNVDPSGEAVIAGRAAPNAKVELRDDGKAVAEATADAAGQFVIIPPALAPGDHSLSLAASAEKAAPVVSSPVAVSVPAQEAKVAAASVPAQEAKVATAASVPAQEAKVTAALPTNPNGPAPSALGMRTLATPSSANGSRVAIHSVEADASGGLVAKGSAEPHATVRLYLNQAELAEAKTQSDGHWSFTIQRGMSPGGYVMRADEMSASGASVVASANAPFVYPDAPSPAPTASAVASAVAAPSPRLARGRGGRIGSNQARGYGAHFMGAQPKLLWRPDALPRDRRRKPGANLQSQSHLSGRSVRRPQVGRKTIVGAMPRDPSDLRRRARPSHRRHAHLGGS